MEGTVLFMRINLEAVDYAKCQNMHIFDTKMAELIVDKTTVWIYVTNVSLLNLFYTLETFEMSGMHHH